MSTVLLGSNRIEDCRNLISYRGRPLLRVEADPLRITLRTPDDAPDVCAVSVEDNRLPSPAGDGRQPRIIAAEESVSVFWEESPLVIATRLDPRTIHVKLDLRPIGMAIFDDADGLHLGSNVLAHNAIINCESAVGLT
jgi:hypothetical protein